jgi:uncharacterized protein (TIRG00374 family)
VLRAAGWFLCSWVLDAGCLIGACLAVGWTPPWSAFPVAYAAAQLASLLPITPGGLGIVEGGLAMMLAAGGPSGQILGAVLVYRLLAYWATLPGGVLAYLAVRAGRERAGGPAERGDGTLFQTAAPAAA